MKQKVVICILLLFITFPSLCNSEVSRFCAVSYLADRGWSEEYKVEVVFLTGYEINDLETGNPAYNPYMSGPDWSKLVKFFYDKQKAAKSPYKLSSNFICIWFSQDEVAILELPFSGYIGGNRFSPENFRSLFSNQRSVEVRQVNSPNNRKWRIRAKEDNYPFRFIDGR